MVTIRPLLPTDDAAAAGRVVQQAYFALPGYPRDVAYDALLGDVAARAQQATVLVAVADDGVILGCLTFVPDAANPFAEHTDPEAASLRCFGMSDAAQGQGIGSAMVQWCLDAARATGMKRLRLHTLTMMDAAQRLYQRMGFVRAPEHDANWAGVIGLAFVCEFAENGP